MEIVVNIGVLITVVGFLLFLMRRIDNLRVEIKANMEKMEAGIRADMEKMETGLKEDMSKMETRIISDMNLKHGEVREDMRDIRVGLVAVRERQARFEGILEGMGHTRRA